MGFWLTIGEGVSPLSSQRAENGAGLTASADVCGNDGGIAHRLPIPEASGGLVVPSDVLPA